MPIAIAISNPNPSPNSNPSPNPSPNPNQGGRDGGDQSKAKGSLSALQRGFLQAEQEWVAWGEKHGVRVVVMRVADRVYAPSHSALERVATGQKPNL